MERNKTAKGFGTNPVGAPDSGVAKGGVCAAQFAFKGVKRPCEHCSWQLFFTCCTTTSPTICESFKWGVQHHKDINDQIRIDRSAVLLS